MRAPDPTRSTNFAPGMGFALVTAVGWGLNWPVPKYLLTEDIPVVSVDVCFRGVISTDRRNTF